MINTIINDIIRWQLYAETQNHGLDIKLATANLREELFEFYYAKCCVLNCYTNSDYKDLIYEAFDVYQTLIELNYVLNNKNVDLSKDELTQITILEKEIFESLYVLYPNRESYEYDEIFLNTWNSVINNCYNKLNNTNSTGNGIKITKDNNFIDNKIVEDI